MRQKDVLVRTLIKEETKRRLFGGLAEQGKTFRWWVSSQAEAWLREQYPDRHAPYTPMASPMASPVVSQAQREAQGEERRKVEGAGRRTL